MKCPNCGKEVPERKKFCGYCGAEMKIAEEELKTVRISKKEENKKDLEAKRSKAEGLPKDSEIIKKSSWKECYRPSILIAIWWLFAQIIFFFAYFFLIPDIQSYTISFLLLFIVCMSVPSILIHSKLKNKYHELKKETLIIVLIWVGLVVLNFVLFIKSDFELNYVIYISILAFFASLITFHLIDRS